MKQSLLLHMIIAFLLMVTSDSIAQLTNNGELSDPFKKSNTSTTKKADAPALKTVTIGNTWTAENLNVTTFRNGDAIPEAKTDAEWKNACAMGKPAWCYYNNDPANGEKYGRLYNWAAVNDARGLAPAGWHIPTRDEWNQLFASSSGIKLRAATGWNKNVGTGESGFNCLPGGFRTDNGNGTFTFNGQGNAGYWWTATESSKDMPAWAFSLEGENHSFGKNMYDKDGLSVRCVKDK